MCCLFSWKILLWNISWWIRTLCPVWVWSVGASGKRQQLFRNWQTICNSFHSFLCVPFVFKTLTTEKNTTRKKILFHVTFWKGFGACGDKKFEWQSILSPFFFLSKRMWKETKAKKVSFEILLEKGKRKVKVSVDWKEIWFFLCHMSWNWGVWLVARVRQQTEKFKVLKFFWC